MRAREYRFPRIERTEIWSSGRQLLRVTTRAPWQLISMVGAISEVGLSGLLNFTNIFNDKRCSFRLKGGAGFTTAPLGRAVQHHHPPPKSFRAMVRKGNSSSPNPVPRLATLLALRGEPITIRLPAAFARTVHLGGTFV